MDPAQLNIAGYAPHVDVKYNLRLQTYAPTVVVTKYILNVKSKLKVIPKRDSLELHVPAEQPVSKNKKEVGDKRKVPSKN